MAYAMPAKPETLPAFDEWAGQLACPACLETLRLEAGRMVCTGCRRAYPVVDGIPVLIVERAEAAP
jgi:uncharacterized protein